MRLIASSNNGDTVSTNCFLFSPVNSDQIPVLGKENASRNSHWLSRFAGLQDCNFAFTWQGCSCIAVTYRIQMSTTRHRFPVNIRLFFHIFTFFFFFLFYFPKCFFHSQAASCFLAQIWCSAELFQTSHTSLALLFSSEMNNGVETHFHQWAVKIQMSLVWHSLLLSI